MRSGSARRRAEPQPGRRRSPKFSLHRSGSDETALEKERLLAMQRQELELVRKETQRTYELYQQEKLDADGFSKFYAPLEERRKQIEAALPRMEAELDILKVSNLSAAEIATQAGSLYDHWQTMPSEEKRGIVEVITDKIIIGKDEITINLCYAHLVKIWQIGGGRGGIWTELGSFSETHYSAITTPPPEANSPITNERQYNQAILQLCRALAITHPIPINHAVITHSSPVHWHFHCINRQEQR